MKKVIFHIILLISVNCFCQNKIINIEYEIFYNTDLPNTQFANLYINKFANKSIYIKKPKSKESREIKKEEDNSFTIKYSSKNNSNHMDFKNNALKSIESIFGEEYLIEEKIPQLKWELIDETKMIDTISVSKAVCEFRGRKYIAWYSLDYPLKYGPWKLQGLPGLIFEVYDETKRYNWIIKKINYEFIDEKKFMVTIENAKKIDIKEYPNIKYNNNSIDQKLMTQLPRGTSISSSEITRNGLEIKFEWEGKNE